MKKKYITPAIESLSLDTDCFLLNYSTGFGDDPADNPANARETSFFDEDDEF